MEKEKHLISRLAPYCLLGLIALTYIVGLSVYPTSDAAKYAAISRTIYEGGDWINLQSLGLPYDQKPPLLFWLSALSFHIFGLSTWAFKLPTLLLSMLGIYATYGLGKLLYPIFF